MVRTTTDDRRIDRDAFREWAEEQMPKSRSTTARIIVDDEDQIKFRIREEDEPEDIVVIDAGGADYIRFTKGDEHRQFGAHRRDVTFHDKTLIVRTEDGREICRAGTGTKTRKGPFPV